jgi:hypothetical protein
MRPRCANRIKRTDPSAIQRAPYPRPLRISKTCTFAAISREWGSQSASTNIVRQQMHVHPAKVSNDTVENMPRHFVLLLVSPSGRGPEPHRGVAMRVLRQRSATLDSGREHCARREHQETWVRRDCGTMALKDSRQILCGVSVVAGRDDRPQSKKNVEICDDEWRHSINNLPPEGRRDDAQRARGWPQPQ